MIHVCFLFAGGWYYTCLIATAEEKETSLLIVRMCRFPWIYIRRKHGYVFLNDPVDCMRLSCISATCRKCNYVNDAVEVKGQLTIRRSDFCHDSCSRDV